MSERFAPYEMLSRTLFRLHDARIKSGLSQSEVASKMNLNSPSAISHYEMGKRELSVRDLLILCSIYDVSVTWVLTGENPNFDAQKTASTVSTVTEELKHLIDKLNELKFGDV